ncbi:hypothetical protein Tco_1010065 [Tanacetum coccineum]
MTKIETYFTVDENINKRIDSKVEAVHIVLTRIDNDIYSIVDACANAKEMWIAIERLIQGDNINKQDVETNLYWAFRKFTSWDGESLESYYSRFYRMMNELVRNKCDISNHQINVQFLLQLQPEWQRFVTIVKQGQDLRKVSYHTLFDILKHIRMKKEIARAPSPPLEYEIKVVNNEEDTPRDKEIDKLMNKNVESTLGTRYEKSTPRAGYERQTGQYENQRTVNVVKDRDTVQDSNEEPTDQELEAHYLYMAKIQECDSNITPNSSDTRNNGREANQDKQKFQEHITLKEHSTGCSYMPSDINDFKNYINHVKFVDPNE